VYWYNHIFFRAKNISGNACLLLQNTPQLMLEQQVEHAEIAARVRALINILQRKINPFDSIQLQSSINTTLPVSLNSL